MQCSPALPIQSSLAQPGPIFSNPPYPIQPSPVQFIPTPSNLCAFSFQSDPIQSSPVESNLCNPKGSNPFESSPIQSNTTQPSPAESSPTNSKPTQSTAVPSDPIQSSLVQCSRIRSLPPKRHPIDGNLFPMQSNPHQHCPAQPAFHSNQAQPNAVKCSPTNPIRPSFVQFDQI